MADYSKKKIENLLARVEKSKIEKKKAWSNLFPITGLYELLPEDYKKLKFLLKVAREYCRKMNTPFSLDILPDFLKDAISDVLFIGHNKWVNYQLTSSEKLFYSVDLEKEIYTADDLTVLVEDWFNIEEFPVILITGLRGSGKTDFALKIAESVQNEFEIACNFETEFERITKASDLLIWIAKNWDAKKIFIFDEGGINVDSRRSMSSENVGLSHLLHISRKLKVSLIAITQFEQDIEVRIRRYATVIINKRSKRKAEVEIPSRGENYTIEKITKTRINFDTNDLGLFEFDVSLDDYLEIFNQKDKKMIIKTLKSRLKSEQDKQLEVINAIKRLHEEGKDQIYMKEIAELTGLAAESIGHIVSKLGFVKKRDYFGVYIKIDDFNRKKLYDVGLAGT